MRTKMVLMVPFTGLGLYGGFRGNRWLRNRIKIFEQFVIPSLRAQTDKDFVLWIAWRREERDNRLVKELLQRLAGEPFKVVFTYSGVPMWDDKYPDTVARDRLFNTLRTCMSELLDPLGECEEIIWLMQPSDDVYDRHTVESVKKGFRENPGLQALSFRRGYLCNYTTMEVKEYNPSTNPPFAAIRFPRNTFIDSGKHMTYISLKEDAGQYKKGTPLPSHEYLPKCLQTGFFDERGFMVGTHGENISTHFNHPFGGATVLGVLKNFGLEDVKPLTLPYSLRKAIMRRLPHQWRRKLRYWFGELLANKIYNWIRS